MSDRPHILVVDDDEDIRTIVRTLLEHAGYETSAAAGGREALGVRFGQGYRFGRPSPLD